MALRYNDMAPSGMLSGGRNAQWSAINSGVLRQNIRYIQQDNMPHCMSLNYYRLSPHSLSLSRARVTGAPIATAASHSSLCFDVSVKTPLPRGWRF